MLANMGTAKAAGNPAILEKAFQSNLVKVKKQLAARPIIDVLYISHRDIIQNPVEQAKIVNEFLGNNLNEEAMAAIVDPNLYRERAGG